MLYIGIPTYDHKLHWRTEKGLEEVEAYCLKNRIGFSVDVIPGDAFVGKARDVIAHRFLKSGFRDLLFVDADIGFDAHGVASLCKAEPPIVMGLYRQKTKVARYPAMLFDPIERHPSDSRLVKLQNGPAGFLRIRREVFDVMKEKWPEDYYVNVGEERVHEFFPAGRVGHHWFGEDIQFCQRAQECGFDIYAMQNIKLTHSGENCWESEWAIDVVQIDEERPKRMGGTAA